ncbi:MAG: sulfatase-like hydrolase/transferase, partial [Chloroflexi bacterium]|nr:sulfatase-like hydrolase/transferase [Chloroflexota bacterium]
MRSERVYRVLIPQQYQPRPCPSQIAILRIRCRDHLTVYGYDRPTTPKLLKLAEAGVRVDNAYSPTPTTAPTNTTTRRSRATCDPFSRIPRAATCIRKSPFMSNRRCSGRVREGASQGAVRGLL